MLTWICAIIFILFAIYGIIRRTLDNSRIKCINKKYVLITGCDTGFGYDTAKKFDKLGCYVIAGKN